MVVWNGAVWRAGVMGLVGAILAMGVSASAVADERGYYTTPYGEPVRTTYGECWRTQYPVEADQSEIAEMCGDMADADGDGVADADDACPGTPADAEVDARGCALDDDGDGVANIDDRCPGTASGAEVDARGCALDDDGDGVANIDDRCPGTPSGAKVNARGCEIVETVEVDLDTDEFEFDSARLRPEMKQALRAAARRLKSSAGEERLRVIGYTDSIGAAAYNRDLSLRRARSVADFLADQGIERSLITVDGRGESDPIATNETAEGRAQNRRVIIETR